MSLISLMFGGLLDFGSLYSFSYLYGSVYGYGNFKCFIDISIFPNSLVGRSPYSLEAYCIFLCLSMTLM